MNSKSISELTLLNKTINLLSAMQEGKILQEIVVKDIYLNVFLSYNLDFGPYTKTIIEALYLRISLFNDEIAYMLLHLEDMKIEVENRIKKQYSIMNEFNAYKHGVFMHKNNPEIWQNEIVLGDKEFEDKDIRGNTIIAKGLLEVENIIEGVTKKTLYLV